MPIPVRIGQIFFAFMLLAPPLSAIAQAIPRLPPALDGAVKSLIILLSDDSVKASEVRLLRTVRLDDGTPDDYALVSFTLAYFSGGNEYFQYLAAFERTEPPDAATRRPRYRLVAAVPVGGKAWRSADFAHLRYAHGRIEFDTKEYRGNEPFCCPSKPGNAVYLLDRLQLKEVDPR